MRRQRLLLLAILFAACSSGSGVSVDVQSRNVLGSYTAIVTNNGNEAVQATCTVRALTDDGSKLGEDTFTVDLESGAIIQHQGKIALDEGPGFAASYDGACSTD